MLESLFTSISNWLSAFLDSLISVLKVLVRGHFTVSLPARQQPVCAVLGNGPSLNQSLVEHIDFLRSAELSVVNGFALADAYVDLKPQNYVLLDPGFYLFDQTSSRDDLRRILANMVEQTAWPMSVYVPQGARGSYFVQQLQRNVNVKLVYFNYTVVRGFRWLRLALYRSGLGMPQCQNVLAASLSLMINRRFETIYLFGADHSWHEEIRLGDANELLMRQPHFYDQDQPVRAQPVYDVVHKEYSRMSAQFLSLHKAFFSYEVLKDYANSMGITVLNASAKSYVDAFPRIQLMTKQKQNA